MRSVLFLLLLAGCATPPRRAEGPGATEVDRVVRDLCDKRVALLGEDSHHGSARTLEVKVELTRRLVEECRYDAFFIEAGVYDFLRIQERLDAGQPITEDMVADAVEGMWANEEVAPLVPLLTRWLRAGTVVAGGLDDQVNRGTYAQREMAPELLPALADPRRAGCGEEIERYMSWRYDDAHRFTAASAARIQGCWAELAAGASTSRSHGWMARNLERFFARQVAVMSRPPPPEGSPTDWSTFNDRDQSMFANLQWHLSRSPGPRKAIVWLATVHAAKDLEHLDDGGGPPVPFGSHVRARFGEQAFVLGFSALQGKYSLASTPRTYDLEPARADSLEAWALSSPSADSRYVDAHQLREIGTRVARAVNYRWMMAPWDTVIDGLLVFREEAPPRPRALPSSARAE
ncbi:erythromycin esterase family protein [Myxococcus faecalis]|uniref:erythromycin esterase family protein n=1 Tax=Myxococcus faecalis TaxID=3115646 RepID=UPI003CE9CB44